MNNSELGLIPITQVTDSIYDLVGAEVPPRVKSQNVERVFCNMDTDKDGVISLEARKNFLWCFIMENY